MSATTAVRSTADLVLETSGLVAGYDKLPVLADMNIRVHAGEIVLLLGRNGAGKTTTLMSVVGHLRAMAGEVRLNGKATTQPAFRRVRDGVGVVGEERTAVMGLTVLENLKLGRGSVDGALEWFPELRPHLNRKVGMLSGGQQQMLAVARALASEPKLLVADELSLGLAPVIVDRLMEALLAARSRGVGVLLVEQHAAVALKVADYAYLVDRGSVVMEGTGQEMLGRLPEIERTYLAGTAETRGQA